MHHSTGMWEFPFFFLFFWSFLKISALSFISAHILPFYHAQFHVVFPSFCQFSSFLWILSHPWFNKRLLHYLPMGVHTSKHYCIRNWLQGHCHCMCFSILTSAVLHCKALIQYIRADRYCKTYLTRQLVLSNTKLDNQC